MSDGSRRVLCPTDTGVDVQDVTASVVAATGKGCYWNQDVKALTEEAGLKIASRTDSLGGLITLLVAEKDRQSDSRQMSDSQG